MRYRVTHQRQQVGMAHQSEGETGNFQHRYPPVQLPQASKAHYCTVSINIQFASNNYTFGSSPLLFPYTQPPNGIN
ncbi:hypothetical protein STEG23_017603 [Scotinomys teguina]